MTNNEVHGRRYAVAGGLLLLSLFANPSHSGAVELGREEIPATEAADTHEIKETILRTLRSESEAAPGKLVRRDAHAKAHGCVKATFEVLPSANRNLRQGVFARSVTYPAWIRFSNGSGRSQDDRTADARGMGIKLMGVPGEKLLAGDEKNTQDFVLVHHDAFFVRNARDYLSFFESPVRFALLRPFHEGLRMLEMMRKKITNPFESRYWSMTPYALGTRSDGSIQAMKYSAVPVPCSGSSIAPTTAPDGPNFLREAMVKTLAARNVCFDFRVQIQRDARTNPIEDPTIAWEESAAPFISVAKIRIPRVGNEGKLGQDRRERRGFCENLSISPWHALPEHRPLGGINRVRGVVYEAISQYRHGANGRKRIEPTGFETF